jgi:antitoxin CptB
MAANESQDLGRLRWRCRRGMKELDVLLTRYVEEQFSDAPAAHQAAFRELLEEQDTVLYAYCLGQERPPTALLSSLIERITISSVDDRYCR